MFGFGKKPADSSVLDHETVTSMLAEPEAPTGSDGADDGVVWELPSGSSGGPDKVLPSVSMLAQIRRVVDNEIEDLAGHRFAVWEVSGRDSSSDHVLAGWGTMLNAMEFPVQILMRQHAPDFADVRSAWIKARPPHMREGRINRVGNSLLDLTEEMEYSGAVVSRRWYISCSAAKAMELEASMLQAGLSPVRLDFGALSALYQACVSGMGVGHSQEVYQVREYKKHLELNERFVAFLEISKWPRRISQPFLEDLLRTGEEMDFSMWLWPMTQRESFTRLQMQRSRFEGAKLAAEQSGKLVGPDVQTAIEDTSRISDEIHRGLSRLYRRTLMFAVYGRTREQLDLSVERVLQHFRASLSEARVLVFRQGKAYASMMPVCRKGLEEANSTDSRTLLHMFPFSPHDLDQREGTFFGMDMRSRTPVMWDPFAPKSMNGHMVVMARSGAGKSFLTKLRVVREALRDVPVYLIDPEGEYGVITRMLGGEVLVPGRPGHGLNPFVIGNTGDIGDLASRVATLCSLVGVMLEGYLPPHLKAIIDACMMKFYLNEAENLPPGASMGTGGVKSFYDFLLTAEGQSLGGGELAPLIATFATGSAQFVMRGDSRDLMSDEAPVTSFNLSNLPGALKPVAITVCAEVVWGLAVSKPRPRILVVDECWTVLATPSGAESLITIVKRARKHKLGLMTITQDVQDFLAEDASAGAITGHAGRALIQNSATKLALSQDPGALPQVVEALGLDEDAGQYLATCMRGQGLLIGEDGSPFPMEIISTNEERELLLDESWRSDGESAEDVPGDSEPAPILSSISHLGPEVPDLSSLDPALAATALGLEGPALESRLAAALAAQRQEDEMEPGFVPGEDGLVRAPGD